MLDRIYGSLRGIVISDSASKSAEPDAAVPAALEDDLNTPKALSAIFNLARQLNKAENENDRIERAAVIRASSELLGVAQGDVEAWFSGSGGELSSEEIEALIDKRKKARAEKDFATADAVRDELAAAGVAIEDGASGTRWRRDG